MTAPAAAPASAPIAPAAPRAAPQPPADAHAFAAVLDSLPGAATKAGDPVDEKQAHPSNDPRQEESQRGQAAGHPLLSDGTLLASLPFAVRAASMMDERPQSVGNAASLPATAMKGPRSEGGGASLAAGARTATVARLTAERAFHFGAAASAGMIASRIDAPFAPSATFGANLALQADPKDERALASDFLQVKAMPAKPLASAVPSIANAAAPAPIAPRSGMPQSNRVSPTRAGAHEGARSGRQPEVPAPPPAARAANSTAAASPAESSAKADSRPPDPIASAASSTAPTNMFGAQLSAPFVGPGAPFEPDVSTASATDADIAPRASALAAGSPASASPVREIDVDLSPGGLEDVSMTMRLAGDKLSVVIRAASSQTLGSIEGARDAIADRLAAIGQPLDSLIVKQTGVNIDGNANGNAASADHGSGGEKWRSAQGAGERGGSNDASFNRRGHSRDRSF